MKKVPLSGNSQELITVLLVSNNPDDVREIQDALREPPWRVWVSGDCSDAIEKICFDDVSVVLCERDLPDGDWRRVFAEASQRTTRRPALVVASHHADEHLWAEVLNVGGYDVLLKPFRASEVERVLYTASAYCRRSEHAHQTAATLTYRPH